MNIFAIQKKYEGDYEIFFLFHFLEIFYNIFHQHCHTGRHFVDGFRNMTIHFKIKETRNGAVYNLILNVAKIYTFARKIE